MSRAGVLLMVVGFVIAVLAWVQFEAVLGLSNDPNPNPVVNGILMWLGWGVGGVLALVGLVVALLGRVTRSRT